MTPAAGATVYRRPGAPFAGRTPGNRRDALGVPGAGFCYKLLAARDAHAGLRDPPPATSFISGCRAARRHPCYTTLLDPAVASRVTPFEHLGRCGCTNSVRSRRQTNSGGEEDE